MADGITLDVSIDDKRVRNLLKQISRRMGNPKPAMQEIADIVKSSIRRNFREEGRPAIWPKSARAKDQGGQTLSDTARLRRSFTARATNTEARVSTNVEYAAAHHFGVAKQVTESVRAHQRIISQAFGKPLKDGPKKIQVGAFVRSRRMDLPARLFMMVQDEDWTEIRAALTNYLRGK